MIELIRTNSKNNDFIKLVNHLNTYLKVIDGEDHDFYKQYNNIDTLNHVVVAYNNKIPVGCGAFKEYNSESVEIKRMFTVQESRGKGIASAILQELEQWASKLNYKASILETGKRQNEAVSFYKKMKYSTVPNFGQYRNIDNSICFKKILQ